MKTEHDYTIKSFPSSRQFTFDAGKIGRQKHHVKALIEIDVSESRKKIKNIKEISGKKISFTSWILKCIGHAINEHKQVHALRKGKNKLIIFDNIDISIMVEKEVDGDLVPIPLVLRNINKMGLTEIYNEIERAKKEVIKSEKNYVIEENRKMEPMKLYAMLPQFVRLIIWRIMLSNPHKVKQMMGTVVVTSIGMAGKINGWVIPFSIHSVSFALGSIVLKPGIVNDTVSIREFLQMTILIDHDVIDGAPAARFVSRLTEIMEKGYYL